MTNAEKAANIIERLEASGNRPLAHPQEMAILLECASTGEQLRALNEAGFIAKFLVRTMGIMRRIGRTGNGYEQLEREFAANVTRFRELLGSLNESNPEITQLSFAAKFLEATPSALENLLSLCDDLMRYKNWRLDEERGIA